MKKQKKTLETMVETAKKEAKRRQKTKTEPVMTELLKDLNFSIDEYFKPDGEFMKEYEKFRKDSETWFDVTP